MWCIEQNFFFGSNLKDDPHAKMEAQSEHAHIACTIFFFCMSGADLHAQSEHATKIFASELSRRFIEGPLLVGQFQ